MRAHRPSMPLLGAQLARGRGGVKLRARAQWVEAAAKESFLATTDPRHTLQRKVNALADQAGHRAVRALSTMH